MPALKGYRRPRTHDLREILSAVFYILKSGCQWRLLPHDFPRWPTVCHYFRAWHIDGTWERMHTALKEQLGAESWSGGYAECDDRRQPVGENHRKRGLRGYDGAKKGN